MRSAICRLPRRLPVAVFQVITQRYRKGSICLTTNLQVGSWGKIFDDPWWPPPCWTGSCTAVLSSTSTATATGCASTGPDPSAYDPVQVA